MNRLELKIPPPLLMAITAALMWLTARPLPGLAFDFTGRHVAAAIIALMGGAFAAAGAATFRRVGTTIIPLKPENTSALVLTGVYRLTRNPMYLGLLCVLTAWTLQLDNFAVAVFPVLFVLYMNRFQIRPEERHLNGKFGEDYAAYCRKVRRW